jgi:hypothetical protein
MSELPTRAPKRKLSGTKVFGLIAVPALFVAIVINSNLPSPTPAQLADDANKRSLGYVYPGQCMSGADYERNVGYAIKNTDWSKVPGSATWDHGVKSLIAGIKVFEEMDRLGSTACPDLKPVYDKYLAGAHYKK